MDDMDDMDGEVRWVGRFSDDSTIAFRYFPDDEAVVVLASGGLAKSTLDAEGGGLDFPKPRFATAREAFNPVNAAAYLQQWGAVAVSSNSTFFPEPDPPDVIP